MAGAEDAGGAVESPAYSSSAPLLLFVLTFVDVTLIEGDGKLIAARNCYLWSLHSSKAVEGAF